MGVSGKGVGGRWFVVDACCLLSMQSFRKVPKVTKIKDGRVARADLKASKRDRKCVEERETKREGDRASCEIFYVPARHWLAIDLCHLSGRFKVSIPDLADFKLHFSQIAYSKRAQRGRRGRRSASCCFRYC